MVASCYLTSTGKTCIRSAPRGTSKCPARPAKHTRLTYIHEAFPTLLYQTRYGVICFATFQQPVAIGLTPTRQLKSPTRRHTSPRDGKHGPNTFDAKTDKSSPGTGREAAASVPMEVPSAAGLISFDLFVPAKSSRSGCILRVITRALPAKNFRKRCPVEFRRKATARYFWGSASATRRDEGRTDREGCRGTA